MKALFTGLVLIVTLGLMQPLYALSVDVNNAPEAGCSDTTGTPYCTIQAAVDAVALDSGTDHKITIAAGKYDESVSLEDPSLALNLIILEGDGADMTIIDASGKNKSVVKITTPKEVTLSKLTLQGGQVPNGSGGAIYLKKTGELILKRVSLMGNKAENGGAIWSEGQLTIENSTLAGNSADLNGGAIWASDGSASIINCTITNNTANKGKTTGRGGGIYIISDKIDEYKYKSLVPVTIANSILHGNSLLINGDRDPSQCFGSLVSEGYNIIGDGSSGALPTCWVLGKFDSLEPPPKNANDEFLDIFVDPEDPNTQPKLSEDPDTHGGTTPNYILMAGSPAIDAVPVENCKDTDGNPLTTDQRGFTRPADGNNDGVALCDIGATEMVCGNGVVEGNEECDGSDDCSATCTIEEVAPPPPPPGEGEKTAGTWYSPTKAGREPRGCNLIP